MTRIAYFDTSAVVKLLVEEEGSAEAYSVFRSSELVATHLITYVETRSALARLKREGKKFPGVKDKLDEIWSSFVQLDLPASTIYGAGDLAEAHALTGYDAVHLSTAIALHATVGEPLLVAAWDRRLNRAAANCGLLTIYSAPH